jgi:hypothetical protein
MDQQRVFLGRREESGWEIWLGDRPAKMAARCTELRRKIALCELAAAVRQKEMCVRPLSVAILL